MLETSERVEFLETRVKVFLAIRKQFEEMIDETEEEFKRYLNVTAIQHNRDWYKVNTDQFDM